MNRRTVVASVRAWLARGRKGEGWRADLLRFTFNNKVTLSPAFRNPLFQKISISSPANKNTLNPQHFLYYSAAT
jgi:hypothetical protein